MVSTVNPPLTERSMARSAKKKVWIDLDNSPHVPFFKPIISELEARGYDVTLTARDCFQVFELADLANLQYKRIGRHYGKNTLAKLMGLGVRTLQMLPTVLREKPHLALSHGSRSSFVVATLLRIPTILICDYEHAQRWRFPRLAWVMAPEIIPDRAFTSTGIDQDHILRYPGIKEDVYTPFFLPDPAGKTRLGLNQSDTIVTIRPPATEAHYHNPESETLLTSVLTRLSQQPDTKTVLVPRTAKQGQELRRLWPGEFASGRFLIPPQVVDGLDLIWCSDLVISGGGTMNREAAALGVPVYSIFRGKLGAVDQYLSEKGRLVLLQSTDDVGSKLKLVKRDRSPNASLGPKAAFKKVVENIVAILES